MYKTYLDVLADFFYLQRCVGCSRRANDILCQGCFDSLIHIGRPFCGRCGAPAALAVYGCSECRSRYFWFDGARSSLRYEGLGRNSWMHSSTGGYLPVVEKMMAPLMVGLLDSVRFDAVVPVSLHRARLAKRGFNQAELMARRWQRG